MFHIDFISFDIYINFKNFKGIDSFHRAGKLTVKRSFSLKSSLWFQKMRWFAKDFYEPHLSLSSKIALTVHKSRFVLYKKVISIEVVREPTLFVVTEVGFKFQNYVIAKAVKASRHVINLSKSSSENNIIPPIVMPQRKFN